MKLSLEQTKTTAIFFRTLSFILFYIFVFFVGLKTLGVILTLLAFALMFLFVFFSIYLNWDYKQRLERIEGFKETMKTMRKAAGK